MLDSTWSFCKYLYKLAIYKLQALHDAQCYNIDVLFLRKRYRWKRVLYIWNLPRPWIGRNNWILYQKSNERLTSLPKVIWEEGRVAAKVSPHWLQWRAPNSPPKVPLPVAWTDRQTPLRYLPYPWTRPTYDAKRHLDPIRRFPQCTGQTDALTDTQTDRSSTAKFDRYRPLRSESDAA